MADLTIDFKKLTAKLMLDDNIIFALVFGSYAKNSQTYRSDLDLSLFFKDPPQGMEFLELISEMSDFIKKEVDIVVLNHASAFLRHQVMKHNVQLFIRDSILYREFREKTMTDYDIYKYVSGMNQYDRYASD
ncbi:nucleotidyltransferase domain-containing protein [Desulfobacterales bacterium HSG16]|nr:nucleotidyltransferase domain-containing protein [Desulfobacterales bacterium HSG16]